MGDKLHQLIHSLSHLEKKVFQTWVTKSNGKTEYLRLFKALEQQESYDEQALRNQKFTYLPRLKNYLWELILHWLTTHEKKNTINYLIELQKIQVLKEKQFHDICIKKSLLLKQKLTSNQYDMLLAINFIIYDCLLHLELPVNTILEENKDIALKSYIQHYARLFYQELYKIQDSNKPIGDYFSTFENYGELHTLVLKIDPYENCLENYYTALMLFYNKTQNSDQLINCTEVLLQIRQTNISIDCIHMGYDTMDYINYCIDVSNAISVFLLHKRLDKAEAYDQLFVASISKISSTYYLYDFIFSHDILHRIKIAHYKKNNNEVLLLFATHKALLKEQLLLLGGVFIHNITVMVCLSSFLIQDYALLKRWLKELDVFLLEHKNVSYNQKVLSLIHMITFFIEFETTSNKEYLNHIALKFKKKTLEYEISSALAKENIDYNGVIKLLTKRNEYPNTWYHKVFNLKAYLTANHLGLSYRAYLEQEAQESPTL